MSRLLDLRSVGHVEAKEGSLMEQVTDVYEKNHRDVADRIKLLPAFANLIKDLRQGEDFVVVIPPTLLDKLHKGLCYLEKDPNGHYFPVIKNSGTKRFENQIRLGKKSPDIARSMDQLIVQGMLLQVIAQLNHISEQIAEIFVEFQNDRRGLVESAYRQYVEALYCKDLSTKQRILTNAIKSAQDSRAQLELRFQRDLEYMAELPGSEEEFKALVRLAKEKIQFKNYSNEIERRVYGLHDGFYGINYATAVIGLCYQELHEADALIRSLEPYREFLHQLTHQEKIVQKLYSYDDAKHADVWMQQPKALLKQLNEFEDNMKLGLDPGQDLIIKMCNSPSTIG